MYTGYCVCMGTFVLAGWVTHWRSSLARRCSMTTLVLSSRATSSVALALLSNRACSSVCCFSHAALCSSSCCVSWLSSRFRLWIVASRGPASSHTSWVGKGAQLNLTGCVYHAKRPEHSALEDLGRRYLPLWLLIMLELVQKAGTRKSDVANHITSRWSFWWLQEHAKCNWYACPTTTCYDVGQSEGVPASSPLGTSATAFS